jgi:hypothetical protein
MQVQNEQNKLNGWLGSQVASLEHHVSQTWAKYKTSRVKYNVYQLRIDAKDQDG